ncbi:MAG: tRNA (adenosine(37)-N6)-threonylcarbamoyltransferase complex dimerization subunit type 1 TsaB [Bdellovibrionales bacterium]|nr:tRNA (adenosine(37)-N6)-threonylcarbamoyltransferase complex dimerization subunit type 1 TsaB [Bdellovibrionales bacterium]
MICKKVCLLIETTSPRGSLGLYSLSSEKSIDRPLLVKEWKGPSHSSAITPAFESILNFYLKPADFSSSVVTNHSYLKTLSSHIAFIALGIGPGRFTGVRVGVSFAKTLGFLLRRPIYPVSSLKILAQSQVEQEKPILVILNAFKNSVYKALYQKKESKLEELIPPCVVLPKDIGKGIFEKCVCIGDAYSVYKDLLPDDLRDKLQVKENIFPKVEYLASLLQRELKVSHYVDWRELKPVYLRSPVSLIKT